ncbi:MAG: DNA alkylation repair protein [Lachnospiraceae bacterium]|nr:DNA alkylation repair protein [Lachnospiraceae bacterium]MDE6254226.1 DNA alkylation repair protein [Lachnospiraceae bacterium]
MELSEVNKRLEELAGVNNEYYGNVIPGKKPDIGVRIPELRKLAKEIAKDDYRYFLDNNTFETFEAETLQAFVIGYAKDDINVLLGYVKKFIPMIHDWSVNDSLCQNFKIARKHQKEVFDFLMEYVDSEEEYEVRVVAVMLMSHFLNDEYIDRVIKVLDRLKCKDYYSRMGVAWAVATVMAKYRDKCFEYMDNSSLDDWTYNKSIQKMLESYRVNDEDKKILREMKRK